VAWTFGHRPKEQKHLGASIVAIVTGRQTPDLKTTNQVSMGTWIKKQKMADDFGTIAGKRL
jgi:hypothetical protein